MIGMGLNASMVTASLNQPSVIALMIVGITAMKDVVHEQQQIFCDGGGREREGRA